MGSVSDSMSQDQRELLTALTGRTLEQLQDDAELNAETMRDHPDRARFAVPAVRQIVAEAWAGGRAEAQAGAAVPDRLREDEPVPEIQVFVPVAAQQPLREWLASQGWELFPIPVEDDLPTFGIGPAFPERKP
jgi:hypothetical protein